MSARSFPPSAEDSHSAGTQLHQSRRSVSRHPRSTVGLGRAGCRCFLVALHYRLISVQAFPKATLAVVNDFLRQ